VLVLAAGALLRVNRQAALPPLHRLREPFVLPWERAPLFDGVTVAFADPALAALVIGLVSAALCLALARPALPPAGRLAVMAAAALCPAMVLSGSMWLPSALVIPMAIVTARLLIDAIGRPNGSFPFALALSALGLLLVDWPAWCPVLAWLAWLLFFRPDWLTRDRARPALVALTAACAAAAGVYGWLVSRGADPVALMGSEQAPVGGRAALALLGTSSAPLLGAAWDRSLALQAATSLLVVVFIAVGWRRASRAGAATWASVLVVGSAGSLVPALALHPVLPFAADKNLWYTSPMVLCLMVASFWPRTSLGRPGSEGPKRSRPGAGAAAALALVLGLAACTDSDEDGWTLQQGDCDDSNAAVYPGAPELWQDGLDNDCDEVIDASDTYIYVDETEPNDTTIGSCFAPEGDDLGHLAGQGLLTRIDGRIDEVFPESYEKGDFDCFSFRVPEVVDHPRLQVSLSWDDPESDLDVVLQGLWDGVQVSYGNSQASGSGPEFFVSSSGFDATTPLWLWVGGYDGPPTDYAFELVLR
jgi:hypothetical protein